MRTDDIISLIALVGLTAFLGLLVAPQKTALLWVGPVVLLGCAGWMAYNMYKRAPSVWSKPRSRK